MTGMSLLSRMRVDLALGVFTVGALLYLYRRDIGAFVGASGQRKRKRDTLEDVVAAPALAPLFTDPSNVDITERILLHCDPQTVMRLAATSKHMNEMVTSSLDLQLSLRQYHHKIPPLIRPSAEQRRQLVTSSKREQLDRLVDREERLSRFRHTKLQRCEMPYIDVLCSGDHMLVTRSLHGKFRIPDDPESGPVEDGFTVMYPEEGRTAEEGELGLEGYRNWTYDVGQEIADIGARSDENLIAIATYPYEQDRRANAPGAEGHRPKTRTLRVAFYHLDECEPHPTIPDRSLLVPHADAKHQVVHFELDAQESRAIRLRLGPDGRLAVWAKHREGCRHARAFVYDWKNGLGIGSPWVNDQSQYGIAQDFTFCTPDVVLIAVLTTTKQCSAEMTPFESGEDQETRLEIRVVRLPPLSAAMHLSPESTISSLDDPIIIKPDTFPRCTHIASFRFPKFTYKWANPGPSPDEVLPVEGGQSFRLVHCSIAAKPSPGTNPSGEDQGLLCITIEGDFGPITHPESGGVPHDHGIIAFCTIAGSVFSPHYTAEPHFGGPKVYMYEDWHQGHVSWDFGPASTWVTGYGTRTTSVSRFVGLSAEAEDGEELPDPDNAKRSTIVNVRLRNYDPVAVQRSGRISRHPLGRPANKLTEKESDDTGLLTPAERRALPPIPDEFMQLVNLTRAQLQQAQIQIHPQGQAPLPPIQVPPLPAQGGLPDLNDLFAGMAGPTPGDTFRVVTKAGAALPEMFAGWPLESSLPFYEANVSIPLDSEDEPRDDAASEHPFKTILARDKLIVCDDAGFDILYF